MLTYYDICVSCFYKNLYLLCHIGSNRFEIIQDDNVIVTGIARIPDNIENEKIATFFIGDEEKIEEMNTKDIYKKLRLRGYQYTGMFRGLKSASITAQYGHIVWENNWITFMDNMLQMVLLGQNSKDLFVLTEIRKVVIDPEFHMQEIQNLPFNERRKFKKM